jgi:chromate transporter
LTGLHPLTALAIHFATLSLFAFGGINSVIPEMHRHAVEVMGWMTDEEFAQLFAIGNAAPGPNMLVTTLVGWHVAGLAGALIATAAICAPAFVFTYLVFRLIERYRDRPWRAALQIGLARVTVGLIAASAFLIARAADTGMVTFAITVGTALLAYGTKLNPLWGLAAGGAIGFAGLV